MNGKGARVRRRSIIHGNGKWRREREKHDIWKNKFEVFSPSSKGLKVHVGGGANSCENDNCSSSIDIPLMSKLNAPLKAELDISNFNQTAERSYTKGDGTVQIEELVAAVDNKTEDFGRKLTKVRENTAKKNCTLDVKTEHTCKRHQFVDYNRQ
ncbi:unnamed protein product [Mytilus edulis]|uniref:Uncharacterized protein n=1 Tax=Mytilus edulis TaxID=6550 RepID=A0A8S3S503_MYTED|nr:unnamed protein product [Mytilus edulis]